MVSCNQCDGKCCKYVTIVIDDPEDKEDWDEIKWWLMHDNIIVYYDNDDDWVVEFATPCKHLDKNNLCKIYDARPLVCREYKLDECEANDGDYKKILFTKPEDVDDHIKKNNIKL